MGGAGFGYNNQSSANINKLREEASIIKASIAIAETLEPFCRNDRAKIVKHVQEALGCKDDITIP